jgi:4'-phosphopantetheinyl transferase EntD
MCANLSSLPEIARGLRNLLPARIEVDVRSVDPASCLELLPEEAALTRTFCTSRRNEFATGRQSLHHLLRKQGQIAGPILMGNRREPILPKGWLASITHCNNTVATILTHEMFFTGIGIDIENRKRITTEIESIIIDRYEKNSKPKDICSADWLALHFCSKESVFKSIYYIIKRYIEFTDIQLSLANGNFFLKTQQVGAILQNIDVTGSVKTIGDLVISGAWVNKKS